MFASVLQHASSGSGRLANWPQRQRKSTVSRFAQLAEITRRLGLGGRRLGSAVVSNLPCIGQWLQSTRNGMAQPGERVWIRHSTEVWEPAVVDAVDGLSVQVHAVGGARELSFKDTASLEDGVKRRNEGDIATVDDLVRLPFLHEPAILHVLRSRARAGLIYPNVGAILLAVNPFKRLTSLYDKDAVETQRNAGALRAADPESAPQPPPHCFAVADQAYRQMRSALTQRKPADQAILISGESGSTAASSNRVQLRKKDHRPSPLVETTHRDASRPESNGRDTRNRRRCRQDRDD